jgi:hydroxymethylbilane synthase
VETEEIHEPNGKSRLTMRSILVSVDGSESAEVEVNSDVDSLTAAETFGVEVAKQFITVVMPFSESHEERNLHSCSFFS